MLNFLATNAVWGPTPVTEAIRLCEELIPQAGGNRLTEAGILAELGAAQAMAGRFAAARASAARAKEIAAGLGSSAEGRAAFCAAEAELIAGDPVAAERELGPRDDVGEMGLRSQRAAIRAEALYRQGRYSEAERSASAAREQAPSDNVEAQGFWRLVRAKLLAQKGEFQEAEELARQGLALFRPTDHLHDHCDALLALAEVLRLRGKNGEAAAATEDAIRLYER